MPEPRFEREVKSMNRFESDKERKEDVDKTFEKLYNRYVRDAPNDSEATAKEPVSLSSYSGSDRANGPSGKC